MDGDVHCAGWCKLKASGQCRNMQYRERAVHERAIHIWVRRAGEYMYERAQFAKRVQVSPQMQFSLFLRKSNNSHTDLRHAYYAVI